MKKFFPRLNLVLGLLNLYLFFLRHYTFNFVVGIICVISFVVFGD